MSLEHEDVRVNYESKYPVKRQVYMQTTGKLLPRRISQILRELGLKVWINPKQGNDIDLKVWYNDELILVGEIQNWSIGSLLSERRRNKMISNLNEYGCRRVVIYTTLDQKSLTKFSENGIDVLEIGFQLLPKSYYDYFKARDQIQKRKIDSNSTKEEIRNMLIDYLKRSIICI